MTDETKKLFDAPWAVDEKPSETFGEVFDVMDEDLYLHYARCYDEKTANLVARLQELYDALVEAKNEMFIILNEWALGKSEVDYLASYRERKGKNNYEFFNEIQELLRKVRDGE